MEILKKGREQSTEWIGECNNCGCIGKVMEEELCSYAGVKNFFCPNCSKQMVIYNLITEKAQKILEKIE